MNKISKNLKYHRESNNLSQTALAKATGIPQTTISAYENGTNIPNIINCITLANFYGITIDELIGRDEIKISPIITYNNSTHNGDNKF